MRDILDAVEARWAEVAPAIPYYEAGSVIPNTPSDYPYAVLSVDGGAPVNYRLGGGHATRRWRINVQCFGTDFDEAGIVVERADEAFLDYVMADVDPDATPCLQEREATIIRDPDTQGVMYASPTYTFNARSTADV